VRGVGLAAGFLVGPPLTDSAAAAQVDIPVHEWNICGAACFHGAPDPANVVRYIVGASNPSPWSVSLTEVCINTNQYTAMANQLDDWGYHADFYVAKTGVSNCGGTNYGNVVFALGPRLAVDRYKFLSQEPGATELRGVVCSTAAGFLGDWEACSTHLVNNASYARIQEDQLYSHVTSSMLTIVGGDFNLTPDESVSFSDWRNAYDEIDEVAPFKPTFEESDPDKKIDYIWARDTGAISSPYVPVTTCDGENLGSDHCYYSGRFRVTL
jgi:endonuclease/exonuclease/phosphatase family metal-dependent hydrolase